MRRLHAKIRRPIDLHGGPRGAWLTWSSGAAMRIGYTTAGRTGFTRMRSRGLPISGQHSCSSSWELLAPLGFGPCDRSGDAVEMPQDASAIARVDRMLQTRELLLPMT